MAGIFLSKTDLGQTCFSCCFMQGEAVRMVRQRPVHRTREEMSDLLEQLTTSLDPQCASCLHDRPFFTTVYDLCDAPLTQTQS